MTTQIDKLGEKATSKEVIAKVNEIIEVVNKSNDRRGPKSEREMTDDDARKILPLGEMSQLSHKDAAEKLGLSYAQVYSCRKEFTFKHIHKEVAAKLKKPTQVVDSTTETTTETTE